MWEDRSEVVKEASQLCRDFHNSHSDAPRVPTIRIPGRSYCDVAHDLKGGNVMRRGPVTRVTWVYKGTSLVWSLINLAFPNTGLRELRNKVLCLSVQLTFDP